VYRYHALRRLHRESSYCGYAVAIVRGKGFQIGGHPGAARWIKAGNR